MNFYQNVILMYIRKNVTSPSNMISQILLRRGGGTVKQKLVCVCNGIIFGVMIGKGAPQRGAQGLRNHF